MLVSAFPNKISPPSSPPPAPTVNLFPPVMLAGPFIFTEPLKVCVSFILSPKILLPDEKITDDEIRVTFISSATILPSTNKSSLNLTEPVTTND